MTYVSRHPHSIDALCTLPSSYPSSHSTILTGSSDGLLRAVQLFPTKLLGVVADHGEFPIERIAIDRAGEGHWVGSVGHDEVLKLTDLREVFEDEDGNGDEDGDTEGEKEDNDARSAAGSVDDEDVRQQAEPEAEKEESESDSDEEPKAKKRRKKTEVDPLATDKKRKRRARNDEVSADPSFFADL